MTNLFFSQLQDINRSATAFTLNDFKTPSTFCRQKKLFSAVQESSFILIESVYRHICTGVFKITPVLELPQHVATTPAEASMLKRVQLKFRYHCFHALQSGVQTQISKGFKGEHTLHGVFITLASL